MVQNQERKNKTTEKPTYLSGNLTEEKPETDIEKTVAKTEPKRKLSYKEKNEFEQLEKDIPKLEKERDEINVKLTQPDLPFSEMQQLTQRIGEIATSLEEKEMRWLELSE